MAEGEEPNVTTNVKEQQVTKIKGTEGGSVVGSVVPALGTDQGGRKRGRVRKSNGMAPEQEQSQGRGQREDAPQEELRRLEGLQHLLRETVALPNRRRGRRDGHLRLRESLLRVRAV